MKTIICFGDSITGCLPGTPYRHQYLKWADLLQFALRSHLGPEVIVHNAGHAGDTAVNAVNRLQDQVLNHHPDLTILLLGGNDFSPRLPHPEDIPAAVHEALLHIARSILDSGSRLLILQYPHAQAADDSTAWHHLELANPILADVAQSLGTPTLNLTPAFTAAEASGIPRPELRDPTDGVHLRPIGEITLTEAILPTVLSLLA